MKLIQIYYRNSTYTPNFCEKNVSAQLKGELKRTLAALP